MADEFGQRISGLHAEGDAIISTDKHISLLVKDASGNYAYPTLNASGLLNVTGGQTYARGSVAGATDSGNFVLVIRDDVLATLSDADGDYTGLRVNSTGALWVEFVNTTLAVTQSGTWNIGSVASITGDVNIADGGNSITVDFTRLDDTTDAVAIGDGTNTLAINGDGSINVVTSSQALDSIYTHGSANLVKDTETTVVTRAPSADENYAGIMVSGAGYCEWTVKFGTTSSEATILKFWTTPSNPTQYVDLPDYLEVSSGETILVRGTNREKSASPSSDFTGYASLVRKV